MTPFKRSGFLIEETLVECLNNKKIKDINTNLRFNLKQIFGPLDGEEIVTAKQIDDFIKPDIAITYKGNIKYISLKTGRARQVHTERVDLFANYLKTKGFSQKVIDFFLIWHFADGTTDGTGPKSNSWIKMSEIYENEIKEFNSIVNKDKNFVVNLIDRMVFQGTNPYSITADFIYMGDENFGYLISRKMMRKYVRNSNFNKIKNPHFGPIQFKSNHTKKGFNECERIAHYKTDFYWATLESDLRYIQKRYCD